MRLRAKQTSSQRRHDPERNLDGDARLAKSAEKAVKKWRYKPKMVNREPVEVQTTIAVVFALKAAQ